MKSSVKTQETHFKSKRNGSVQKISAKTKLEEDEQYEEKKNREGRRKSQNFISSSLFLLAYIKRKRKVKSNLFDFGEKLPNNPSSSPNYPYQSQDLLICSIQSIFLQILLTNNSIVKLHIYPYRVSRNLPHQFTQNFN